VGQLNWFKCARYCNWLHNNKPTGAQNNSTTEDGAYTLNGAWNNGNAFAKNAGAKYHIPTENEWYKAAYYKGGSTNAGYWTYATQSNSDPVCVTANSVGDGIIPATGANCIAPTATPIPTPTPTRTPTPTNTPGPTSTPAPTPACCSEAVLKTIDIGHKTLGIAINETSNKAYIACDDDKLRIIDLNTESVLHEINIGLGKQIDINSKSRKVVFDSINNKIYVTNPGDNTVSVIDEVSSSIITNVAVGDTPTGIAISHDSNTIYVANSFDCTISVINVSDYSINRTISITKKRAGYWDPNYPNNYPSPPFLWRIAFVPPEVGSDDGYLIVAANLGTFFVINLTDDTYVPDWSVANAGGNTYDIAFTGFSGSLNPPRTLPSQFYVSNFSGSVGLHEGSLSGSSVSVPTSGFGYGDVQGMAVSTHCSKLYAVSNNLLGIVRLWFLLMPIYFSLLR
jgi:YVTN family beta-propeller protein